MRTLVIQIGNTYVAFHGEHANQVVSALENATVVNHDGWFDDKKPYIINRDAPIEIKFVDDSRIMSQEAYDARENAEDS